MKKFMLVALFIMGMISSVSAQYASIESTWVEHNVYSQGYNCMCVHVELTVDDWQGRAINVSAYIFDSNGNKVIVPYGAPATLRARDGQLCSGVNSRVDYESTYWEDIQLFVPYNFLQTGSYSCVVQVATTTGVMLTYSDPEYFTVGR